MVSNKTSSKSGHKLPDIIPHIHFSKPKDAEKNEKEQPKLALSALNLREIEENTKIEFEPVELDPPELESEKVKAIDRADVLQSIEETALPDTDVIDYAPINFDDLAAETTEKKENDLSDDRWTQILNFNWKEVEIKED